MSNEALADLLGLTDWRDAMLTVPREAFVPDTGLACPEGSDPYPIDRQARPDEWKDAVFSDAAIITQRADGRSDPADEAAGPASSSLSAPGVAFAFLSLLSPVNPGDRVLDVGTGTGYTSAVLAARVGEENVTTVDVDPDVSAQAVVNLTKAGFAPHVFVGDGAAGCPERAPFTRVHATCGVAEIPYAWVEQTRHGGVIVAPWQPGRGDGFRVRLTRSGGAAFGRFHGRCSYMMLRGDRAEVRWKAHHTDQAVISATATDPREVDQAGDGLALLATALAPEVGVFRNRDADGSFSLLMYEVGHPEGSWAACDYVPGDVEFEVTQYGPRRLWDEYTAAHTRWVQLGRPNVERFGLTVAADGQTLWLDEPAKEIGPVGRNARDDGAAARASR
ncbi:methyltransferase domain-containing protein [Actinoallomurus iriomotensis]|uniref:Protein-L-isoaspartate O-methyltransferase n=1 Tax=Actinoallomurus iriomotensis TaxID=478107 RepID=A0A9W6RXS2_9ACTN|nr:methyltransferase domain-containing protein [Actinoallomurus iriomotensis]GLY81820.1 protein-L-isoaspartate O-methyltransferase [Actinoallomurus iriomotensis]